MERRRLGDFEVSVLGLGTSRLASMGAGRSKSDARILLAAARDCGVNFIDTADTYGSTAAERWIGELTAGDPDQWVVTTKTGLPTVDFPGPFRALNQPLKKVKQSRATGFALDARTLRRNIHGSLRRLHRERVEIFLLHLPPFGIANDDEIYATLSEAQQAGLIGEFGVSSDDVETIRAAHDAWGSTWTETQVNPSAQHALADGALAHLNVIANHVMGAVPADGLPPFRDGVPGPGEPDVRQRLLRHAAATPGVKVVLTGTSNPDHLRANATALERPVTSIDLIET